MLLRLRLRFSVGGRSLSEGSLSLLDSLELLNNVTTPRLLTGWTIVGEGEYTRVYWYPVSLFGCFVFWCERIPEVEDVMCPQRSQWYLLIEGVVWFWFWWYQFSTESFTTTTMSAKRWRMSLPNRLNDSTMTETHQMCLLLRHQVLCIVYVEFRWYVCTKWFYLTIGVQVARVGRPRSRINLAELSRITRCILSPLTLHTRQSSIEWFPDFFSFFHAPIKKRKNWTPIKTFYTQPPTVNEKRPR